MSEIVTLQVGKCGNEIGCEYWKLICDEHSIDFDGKCIEKDFDDLQRKNLGVLFTENEKKFIPRTILMDLEPQCLDNIRNQRPIGKLFKPDNFLTRIRGTGNNWGVGCYNEGPYLIDSICEQVRKSVEACDFFGGFQLFHSLVGGTGSGLGSLVINKLKEEYPDRTLMTISEVPSREESINIVEPYNIVFTFYHAFELTDATIIFDNETIQKNLSSKNNPIDNNNVVVVDKNTRKFGEVNRLISKMISGVTSSQRFPSRQSHNSSDLYKMVTNLVPFPRLHFFVPSTYDHHHHHEKKKYLGEEEEEEEDNYNIISDPRVIVNEVFSPMNVMCESSLSEKNKKQYKNVNGKHLTSSLIFRGSTTTNKNQKNITPKEFENELLRYKNENENLFSSWISYPFHTSTTSEQQQQLKLRNNNTTLICNSTTILPKLMKIGQKYSEMYRRRAYAHWFTGCGMDSGAFETEESHFNDIISEIMQYDSANIDDFDCDDFSDDDEEEEEGEGEI